MDPADDFAGQLLEQAQVYRELSSNLARDDV
jgi:hypothetical protein